MYAKDRQEVNILAVPDRTPSKSFIVKIVGSGQWAVGSGQCFQADFHPRGR